MLDFFCPRFRLAVEVDGEAHEYGDRPQRDGARDGWLLTQGVQTLRIPAQQVLSNLEGVIQHIVTTAHNSSPGGGVAPRSGDGGVVSSSDVAERRATPPSAAPVPLPLRGRTD